LRNIEEYWVIIVAPSMVIRFDIVAYFLPQTIYDLDKHPAPNCIKQFYWTIRLVWPIRFDVTIVSSVTPNLIDQNHHREQHNVLKYRKIWCNNDEIKLTRTGVQPHRNRK